MRRPLALAAAALAAIGGSAVLVPPALSGQAEAVATFAPQDARLQLLAARSSLSADDEKGATRARHFAIRSLYAMQYNQPALTLAIASGGVARRTDAANLSAALGWRDTLSNARITRLAIASGAADIAAQRVDALGRTQGGEFAAPAADKVMAMPGGPQALANRARYRSGGLWWISYLRVPAESAEAQAGRMAFARGLDDGEGPWRRTIVGTLIGSLAGDQSASQQLALWRETIAHPTQFGAVLYDEEFANLDTAAPAYGGEWRIPNAAPIAIERSGGSLVLSGISPKAGRVLAQRFEARPGRYRLSANGQVSSDRLRWQILCVGATPIFESGSATGEWQVSIPVNCTVAELRLTAGKTPDFDTVDRLTRVSLEPIA